MPRSPLNSAGITEPFVNRNKSLSLYYVGQSLTKVGQSLTKGGTQVVRSQWVNMGKDGGAITQEYNHSLSMLRMGIRQKPKAITILL